MPLKILIVDDGTPRRRAAAELFAIPAKKSNAEITYITLGVAGYPSADRKTLTSSDQFRGFDIVLTYLGGDNKADNEKFLDLLQQAVAMRIKPTVKMFSGVFLGSDQGVDDVGLNSDKYRSLREANILTTHMDSDNFKVIEAAIEQVSKSNAVGSLPAAASPASSAWTGRPEIDRKSEPPTSG